MLTKKMEVADPNSCLNQAADDEPVFVLRGKDTCAPGAIRAWANARIRKGKNFVTDTQITDSLKIADSMEDWQQKQFILGNLK